LWVSRTLIHDREALWEERKASGMKWRQLVNGVNGIPWDEAAWGKHPGKGRSNVEPFLDLKTEEEGICKCIAAILDSNENGFNANDAYGELVHRDKEIAGEVERVRGIYHKEDTATRTTRLHCGNSCQSCARHAMNLTRHAALFRKRSFSRLLLPTQNLPSVAAVLRDGRVK
jgi:hypothetical protein